MHRITRLAIPALVALAFAAPVAHAQGKSRAAHGQSAAHKDHVPPGHAKKVSTDDAVVVVRDVFERNGYRVVRVEPVGTTRVVWYRRGNNGRGKGQCPLEKMVIKTSSDAVVFQSTTIHADMLGAIKAALHL